MFDKYRIVIAAAGLALGLYPDSRGYVEMDLLVCGQKGDWAVAPVSKVPSEVVEDFAQLSLVTMKWIKENCEDIKYEKRHLYYKFKE